MELSLNIMEATPQDQHSHHGHQDNPNAFISMRDRMHPPCMSAPSCIVPPTKQLVIRPHIVPLLPTFHGMESENHYVHIKEFEDERYMEAINACPHHGFDTWLLVSYFYDGMSSSMKQLLETMCGGDFMSKNPEEAMDFLSYVAEVSSGWDEPNKGEVGKTKSQPNAFNAKAEMYTLNEDIDMKAKDLCTIKRGLNVNKKAFLTEQVNAIIQCKSPLKYKDLGCPTISIMIGVTIVEKALLDMGASVNLLPYSVYKQLGLGELKPTSITLSLVDRSVKIPRGIIEDVLVQVDNFYYLVDFVVLDTDPIVKETNYVPIILGRSFLATSNVIINCRNGLMQLTFGNMTLELNIFYMSKNPITPEEEEGPEREEAQETVKEETPKLNLKSLPMELKYTYLEENQKCPVVISSSLTTPQEVCLLEVLKRCKKAIGWQIFDLTGINHLVCTHHIYMEEEAKPIRQPQIRLNPHMQEVVRAEVLKLLQAGIIYPISDRPWVSPTQVVPKIQGSRWCEMKGRRSCYMPHFSDMVERIMEVFMDDITIYGSTFEECLVNLEAVLNRCIEKDLVLNWEKCHFMVQQGIVLGHIISERALKLIKQRAPNWQLPFEVMCDASDFAIRAVLGQREDGKPYVIYYASKTLNEAQRNYTTQERIMDSLLQEFNLQIRDKKGVENVVADHLSRSNNKEVCPEEEQQGILIIAMRVHVEATLPLRKQP
ncbi:hypothetical protein CK203_096077 [Vitis vinifera]|uniref:Uncharacterized protein n=1 Tax=Vitis vinifera TaxID=29760 RepID=A0A438CN57_VITVI|nr:hypothetical protein CK203_096077 [Vitis vinifera]